MKWNLDNQGIQFAVESKRKKGATDEELRKIWPSLFDAPELDGADWYFLSAFYSLTTCRQFGMGEGPIPWTAIQRYAEVEAYPHPENLHSIISAIDAAYLKHKAKQQEKKRKK